MAGNTRQWAKEKLKSAVNHLNVCAQHLQDVEGVYEKDHPEVEMVTNAVKTGLLLDIEMIERLNDTL